MVIAKKSLRAERLGNDLIGTTRECGLDMPIIESGMVVLRPFVERYLTPLYVSWLNDPATVRCSENWHRKHTLESSRAYVARFNQPPNHLWAVTECASGDLLGNIAATIDICARREVG